MNIVENELVKFWIKDGLLFSQNKKVISIGLEEAKEIVQLRHRISDNKQQYWCLNLNKLKFGSREAHSYLNENGQDFLHACGVVASSYLVKFIVEVFMKVQKPKIPMRIFSTEESAVKWLKEMQNTKNIIENKCLN